MGPDPKRWVLGSDTIVVLGDDVLGKPDDPEHAVDLLSRLIGQRHTVITAVALIDSATLHTEVFSGFIAFNAVFNNPGYRKRKPANPKPILLIELHGTIPVSPFETAHQSCAFTT